MWVGKKPKILEKKGEKDFYDLKMMFGLKMIWNDVWVWKGIENNVWFENDLKMIFGLKRNLKWCLDWKKIWKWSFS